MQAFKQAASVQQFWFPFSSALLAVQGIVLVFSAFGHLLRQQMSTLPIDRADIIIAVVLLVAGVLLFAAYRVFSVDSEPATDGGTQPGVGLVKRVVLTATALVELGGGAYLASRLVTETTNGVSDFILGSVALTGVMTGVVIIGTNELISKTP